jgi:lipid-A-disaccharide synthase
LGLERRLRVQGIPTVHYVSPSVWAWRPWRVRKIARAVNLMLTLLPFEAAFYQQRGVPVRYVGHPLADEIPLHSDGREAQRVLGLSLPVGTRIVALLPGSRMGRSQPDGTAVSGSCRLALRPAACSALSDAGGDAPNP